MAQGGHGLDNLDNIVNTAYEFIQQFIRTHKALFNVEEYPYPQNNVEEDRLLDFAQMLSKVIRFNTYSIEEVIKNRERKMGLGLSVSNYCERNCIHCAANSSPKGRMVPYENLTGFSQRLIELIGSVNFGIEGEPFLYSYNGFDLGDIINHYIDEGINNFTISTGGFLNQPQAFLTIDKIRDVKNLDIRITYSKYSFSEDNDEIFVNTLNFLLKTKSGIIVQLLGDNCYKETNIDGVIKDFKEIMQNEGFKEDGNNYFKNGKRFKVNIMSAVSDVGRFKNARKSLTLIEGKKFSEPRINLSYLCEHFMNYSNLNISSKGTARFCETMYSYNKPGIVQDIYAKDGEKEFFRNWNEFNILCRDYFINNVNDIMMGNKTTCLCKPVISKLLIR